jgi:hypothetical protein
MAIPPSLIFLPSPFWRGAGGEDRKGEKEPVVRKTFYPHPQKNEINN